MRSFSPFYLLEERKQVNLEYLHVVSSMQSLSPPDSRLI